jgi:hypothetical protein
MERLSQWPMCVRWNNRSILSRLCLSGGLALIS